MRKKLQKCCLYLNLFIHLLIMITVLVSHQSTPVTDVAVLILCFPAFITSALYLSSIIFSLPEMAEIYRCQKIDVLWERAEEAKITARPYLILYFTLYIAMLFAAFIASISYVAFIPALPMFLLPLAWYYLVLSSSSLYGIALVLRLVKDGHMSRLQAAGHIFLLLFFICDIIDITYVVREAKKYGSEQNGKSAER